MNTFESEKWWIWISVGTNLKLLLGKFFSFLGKRGEWGKQFYLLRLGIGIWKFPGIGGSEGYSVKERERFGSIFLLLFVCLFEREFVYLGLGQREGWFRVRKEDWYVHGIFIKFVIKILCCYYLEKKVSVSFKFESIITNHLWFDVKM